MSIKTVLTTGQGLTAGIPHEADSASPIELFQEWFDAAKQSETMLPDAASLATASATGIPSARMVLLKHVDDSGFVFYTNYSSQKARELDENPHAAMCIHWPLLQRQVRISGPVDLVDTEENASYFATRSRGSQVGAWASSVRAWRPVSRRFRSASTTVRYPYQHSGVVTALNLNESSSGRGDPTGFTIV